MNTTIISIINKFGYIGILLLIAIENIFPPIPSEVILTFSGFIAESAELNIFLIIIYSTLGSVLGAIILYFFGVLLINSKISKLLHLKEENIKNSIATFKQKGIKSVFFCRLVPILRSLISIPAGLSKMNFPIFLALTTVGSLIWNTILILLGNMVGENYYLVADFISSYYKVIILAVIIIYIIIKRHKAKKIITIK
ncbi:MAG: DedA family protein [Bacilli bacterium]|nr:DedA family protein [Bacilli bacterium]